MPKNREQQKLEKEAKIKALREEIRQAYKDKNTKLADEIMKQIRSIRNGEAKVTS